MNTGIPTTHEGVNFRSRLEARWAAMFTLLGWRWTYEPIDLAGYIPDFLLHLVRPVLVEVKPFSRRIDADGWIDSSRVAWPMEALLVGAAPFVGVNGHAAFGLLNEIDGEGWDEALARSCHEPCKTIGFQHASGRYVDRVCGAYEGGGLYGEVQIGELDRLWREAGNRVQWRPKR